MKRYIKSSLFRDYKEFDGWKEEDIELWKSIDWKARNYEEYPVEDDTVQDRVRCVGLDYGWIPAKFVKCIRSNPIYPPYYRPVVEGELAKVLRENRVVGPMYDGDSKNGYDLHNRYETPEMYDMLSR